MEEIRKEIIDYLARNRVSSTEVADALGKKGVIPNVMPISQGYYRVGKVQWIYTFYESNWPLHEQLQNIEDDTILLIEAFDCNSRAIFGELVSKYCILYHQSRAIITIGKLRDAAALIREKWPIWCEGFNPIGCFNEKPKSDYDSDIINESREKYDGAIAVCDDCGVVLITKENINKDFLDKLIFIEKQEDIWFDRLDRYKENTFEIVCLKKYLNDDIYLK